MPARRFLGLYCLCTSFDDVCTACAVEVVIAFNFHSGWTLVRPHIHESTQPLHIAFSAALAALICVCHARCMFGNPGFVPFQQLEPGWQLDEVAMCISCKSVKPAGAHHCRRCGRCVFRMDHHCQWTNSCIGAGNLKFFLLFIFYVTIASVYASVMMLWRAHAVLSMKPCGTRQTPIPEGSCYLPPLFKLKHPTDLLPFAQFCLAVFFCACFLCFACATWVDQYEAIITGETRIDAFKSKRKRKGNTDREELSLTSALTLACGELPHWRWLLPVRPPPKHRADGNRWLWPARGLDHCMPVVPAMRGAAVGTAKRD